MWNKGVKLLISLCLLSSILIGCQQNQDVVEETKNDVEFTVCHEENLPNELKQLIEKKKEKPFHLSYTTKEYAYIAVGYGEQNMGGYSIQVLSLYETPSQVVIETNLKGPLPSEKKQGISYPYVVVKIQNPDKTISFR